MKEPIYTLRELINMEIIEHNIFCGETEPLPRIETACTTTINEGIYSEDKTWSDGSVHTYWYVVKSTKIIDVVKLAEIVDTLADHDELIAQLMEGSA